MTNNNQKIGTRIEGAYIASSGACATAVPLFVDSSAPLEWAPAIVDMQTLSMPLAWLRAGAVASYLHDEGYDDDAESGVPQHLRRVTVQPRHDDIRALDGGAKVHPRHHRCTFRHRPIPEALGARYVVQ